MECVFRKDNKKCTILADCSGHCENPEECVFRKTREEYEKAIKRANKRLRSLPMVTQKYIADKYHKGKKRW